MNSGLIERIERGENGLETDNGYFSHPLPGLHLYFYGGSHDMTWALVRRRGIYLLGRSKYADFRFSDSDRSDVQVSRRHAFLRVGRDSVILLNQTPKNGLILNGIKLADYQEVPLNDTDIVTLGCNGPNIRIRIGDLSVLQPAQEVCGGENGQQ